MGLNHFLPAFRPPRPLGTFPDLFGAHPTMASGTGNRPVRSGSAPSPEVGGLSVAAWVPGVVGGFGVAVLMWAAGYLTHLRQGMVPAPVIFVVLLAVLALGAWLVARTTPGRAVRTGAITGGVASLVNLLILGSVVSPEGDRAAFAVAAIGSIAAAMGLGAVAGRLASGRPTLPAAGPLDAADWRHAMVLVACVATFFVVIAGGLVTSTETGLAVPDWPNTEGSNTFAYPLEKMVGGIYYEHAHRLYGALVGLCTVATAVVILRTGEPRRWVRGLSVATVVMVCIQGLMGGLRVTGTLTLATEGPELQPNTTLAIAHGIFGQCFFATMVAMAAFTARSWRNAPIRTATDEESPAAVAASGRMLTAVVLVLLLAQLASGAGYRHLSSAEVKLPWPAHIHLTLAMFAVVMCLVAGFKTSSRQGDAARPLRRAGLSMNALVCLQALLGGGALVAILAREGEPYAAEVLLATAHQANGAIVLAVAGLLVVWTRRLPAPHPSEEAAVVTSVDRFDEELRGVAGVRSTAAGSTATVIG